MKLPTQAWFRRRLLRTPLTISVWIVVPAVQGEYLPKGVSRSGRRLHTQVVGKPGRLRPKVLITPPLEPPPDGFRGCVQYGWLALGREELS